MSNLRCSFFIAWGSSFRGWGTDCAWAVRNRIFWWNHWVFHLFWWACRNQFWRGAVGGLSARGCLSGRLIFWSKTRSTGWGYPVAWSFLTRNRGSLQFLIILLRKMTRANLLDRSEGEGEERLTRLYPGRVTGPSRYKWLLFWFILIKSNLTVKWIPNNIPMGTLSRS